MQAIDLNKIGFFKPVNGKTLREQLQGKKLAGAEVVEYVHSLRGSEGIVLPLHWREAFKHPAPGCTSINAFSLTYLRSRYWDKPESKQVPAINGFGCDQNFDFLGYHYRHFEGDPLDMMVGSQWCEHDWILIEIE